MFSLHAFPTVPQIKNTCLNEHPGHPSDLIGELETQPPSQKNTLKTP